MATHVLRRCARVCAVLASALAVVCSFNTAQARPNFQAPQTLIYGQSVDGVIETGQPSAFYEFLAEGGDVITITMVVTGGELDPFIVLNTADGLPLATDDNSGGGANARLTFVIAQPGRYTIQATHAGGLPPQEGGTFALNLTAAVDDALAGDLVESETPAEMPAEQGDAVRLSAIQAGTTIRDTLSRQVAVRYYWFVAGRGDQLIITPEPLADFASLYVLYSAQFEELARTRAGTPLRHSVPDDGVYFLAVALPDRESTGGAYSFSFDRIPNPATAGNFIDIGYGQTQRGTIDASVSAVTYRFTGSAGDGIAISMARAGGDLNSYVYLLDATGQLLFEDNDSGGANGDARLVYTLPQDGTYLIVATRLGQTQGTTSGSYVLELQSDSAPPALIATSEPTLPTEYASLPQIAYGDTVEDELSNANFMDFYVFSGAEGDAVTIEMNSPTLDLPGGLDPFLILLDADRIPQVENDDIVDGVDRNARIELTLPRSGYYAIVATRFDQENGSTSGPYTLSLSGPGGAASATPADDAQASLLDRLSPTALAADTLQSGSFARVAQSFGFSAQASDRVQLEVSTVPDLEPVLILADSDLREVLSSANGRLEGVVLPGTGRYLVIVSLPYGPADQMGASFTLSLSQLAAVPADTPGLQTISFGDLVESTISDDIPSRQFAFFANAGQRVRITMEALPGSELDCYLELQDANQAVVAANDDIQAGVIRNAQIVADLPGDGTFTIIASRYVGPDQPPTAGRFRLTLELLDENAVAGISSTTTPIAYGQTEVDEINDSQYLLFYVFDGTVGDVVTIEVSHLTGNLDSVLHLYRAEGTGWVEIANNDDSPTGGTYAPLLSDIVLPQTGKYLIAIHRYGMERESSYGTFALTLLRAE